MNRRLDLPLRLDGDEPLFPRSPDGDVLDRAEDRPALSVADPSDLRDEDPGGGLVKPDALREAEGVAPPLLAEGREPGPFFEEVPVGPVEVLEGLLEDLRGESGQPDGLRLPFPAGEEVGRADIAQAFLSGGVPFDLEGERPVEDEAAGSGALPEEPLLIGVRRRANRKDWSRFMAPILPQTKGTPYIPASNGGVLWRFSDKISTRFTFLVSFLHRPFAGDTSPPEEWDRERVSFLLHRLRDGSESQ